MEIPKSTTYITGDEVKTDEYVHMLLYQKNVIAAVIETRTEHNYVHFDFLAQDINNPVLI